MVILASKSRSLEEALSGRGFRFLSEKPILVEDERLLEQVRAQRPQLVVLSHTPRYDGLALCERIKSDPELSATRVIIALDRPAEEVQLSRLALAGGDDALLARLPGEELYPLVARLLGLPDLSLNTPVEARDPTWSEPAVPREADAANLSVRSVDLLCERQFSTGAKIELSLRREPGGPALDIAGEVARSDGGGGRPFRARVHFADMPTASRLKLHDFCLWEAHTLPSNTLRIDIRGAFDQNSEFGRLQQRLSDEVARGLRLCLFDLSRVRQITSWGLRGWVLFLRGLPEALQYHFVNGSTLFSRHCGMIADMVGRGEVLSLALPYECSGCGAERARTVHKSWLSPSVQAEPPPFKCGSCGGLERFAELPDRYFSFLRS
jgi:CheY-like chemotaxis protein